MRRTATLLLWGAAVTASAAAIGAATAALLGADADARMDRAYSAMAEAFATRPVHQAAGAAPGSQRPGLVLIRGGEQR